MKTTNLTRNEAMHAMLNGHKTRHLSSDEGMYYFFSGNEFRLFYKGNTYKADMPEQQRYEFYFEKLPEIPKEPPFKEVTMYAPVYSETAQGKEFVADAVYSTKEEALADSGNTIGYTEVKVYLKESEGEDE